MIDKAKLITNTLRYCEETGARCNECPSGMNEQGVSNCPKQSDIADLIEVLAATLKQIAQERDGLRVRLGNALSMLETRTRERDAAIEDVPKCCFYCARQNSCDSPAVYDDGVCDVFMWRGEQGE